MYEFNLPTKIVFGIDALNRLGEEVTGVGDSALLVTGKSAMRSCGILDRVRSILHPHFKLTIFDRVSPEPDTEVVDEATIQAKEKGCNLVIGLGGGSALDVAKATAGLTKEKGFGSVADYLEGEGTRKLTSPGIPFVAIPTTAGTGTEATMNAVIINKKLKTKRSFRSPYLFAKLAIIDPRLTVSMPTRITATSGMDTLVHLIEGYVSKKATPFTDAIAIDGIRFVAEGLIRAVKKGDDLPARERMSQASLFGGILISNSGLGIAHGISSFMGALYGVPHGLANAVLLPYVMEFNSSSSPEKFKRMAQALGANLQGVSIEEASNAAVEMVKEILFQIGIPNRLSNVGIKETDLPLLAEKSLTSSSAKKNPKEVSYDDLLTLLKKAL